jgi:PAS domain S-box-containing protein
LGDQNAALQALSYEADLLLGREPGEDAILQVLDRLGRAFCVSRIRVYESRPDAGGAAAASQRYQWSAPGVEPPSATTARSGMSCWGQGLARWQGVLSQGQAIHGRVRDFPDSEQDALRQQGVLSIMVAPISADQEWWGFACFEECQSEREWSAAEREVLCTAVSILGAAIQRKRDSERLLETQRRLQQMAEALPDIFWVADAELTRLLYVSPAYATVWGLPREAAHWEPKGWVAAMHPEDRLRMLARIREIQSRSSERPALDEEFRIIGPDGTMRWVRTRALYIADEGGRALQCGVVEDITARKRAELALRESEERFRGVFARSPIGIQLYDADGCLVAVNAASVSIFGLEDAEAVKGLRLFASASVSREIKEKLSSGQPIRHEIRFDCDRARAHFPIRKSGILDLDVLAVPLLAEGETTASGYLVQVQDITERRRAESALRVANAKLALLARTALEFALVSPSADAYALIAERLRELAEARVVVVGAFDEAANVLIAKALSGIGTFERRVSEATGFELRGARYVASPPALQALRSGQLHVVPGLYEMAMGRIPRAVAEALERLGDLGAMYGVGFVRGEQLIGGAAMLMARDAAPPIVDIVESFAYHTTTLLSRLQAERALRESEARFRGLFENISDAFILLDSSLCVVDFRDAAAPIFGYSTELVIGQAFSRAFRALCFPRADYGATLQTVLDGGEPMSQAGVRLERSGRPGGDEVYLDLAAYRVMVSGQPHVAILCRDVSEARRLEAEVRHAQRLEALGRLASGVAHDFGKILAVVHGQCDLLLRSPSLDPALALEVHTMLDVVAEGSSLVRQLLAFDHGEKLQVEILHMNALVRSAQPILRHIAGERVALRVELAPEAIFFRGDSTQFKRVLLNLVANARDAIRDAGEIHIKTRLERLDAGEAGRLGVDPGPYAVLVVSDTGMGITAQDRLRIFEPFYTTKDPRNVGLGLPVVYGILQQHDGQVRVESKPGSGTSFYLYFPAVLLDAADDAGNGRT